METALTLKTIEEVHSVAQILVDSGMAPEIKSLAQAEVKIMAGQELGIPPFAAIRGIRFFDGALSLSAGLMSSIIKNSKPYRYDVITKNADGCTLEFFHQSKRLGESSFTMEDAKRAKLTGKDNWIKYPEDMCFARALSRGARTYCADLFFGAIYVEGEVEVVTEPMSHAESQEVAFDEPLDDDVADWNAPGNLADQLTEPATSRQRGMLYKCLIDAGVEDGFKRLILSAVYPQDITKDQASADIDAFLQEEAEHRLPDPYFMAYLRLLRERHGVEKEALRDFLMDYTGSDTPLHLEAHMQHDIIAWVTEQEVVKYHKDSGMEDTNHTAWESAVSSIVKATGYPKKDVEAWIASEFGSPVDDQWHELNQMAAPECRDRLQIFMRQNA